MSPRARSIALVEQMGIAGMIEDRFSRYALDEHVAELRDRPPEWRLELNAA